MINQLGPTQHTRFSSSNQLLVSSPLEQIFGLPETEAEKLISSNIREKLLFAGSQHIAVKILTSDYEMSFVNSNVK